MAMQHLRPASKKWTVFGAAGLASAERQISTSEGIIVRGIIVTGGLTSSAARIRDSRDGSGNAGPLPSDILVSANAGETSAVPIQFVTTQGLFIELEQGGADNGEATIFYD